MRPLYAAALTLAAALPAAAQDMALSQILIDGEGWTEVTKGLEKPYAVWHDGHQIMVFHKPGALVIDADGKPGKTLPFIGVPAASARGEFTYEIKNNSLRVVGKTESTFAPPGVKAPSGLAVWPDQTTLVIGDAEGKHLWAFRIAKDGSLKDGDRYYALRMKPGETASKVSTLGVDDAGRLYALTPLGVQVFDLTGRLCGVLSRPGPGELTAFGFGGPNRSTLYVVCGDTVYARKTRAKGFPPAKGADK